MLAGSSRAAFAGATLLSAAAGKVTGDHAMMATTPSSKTAKMTTTIAAANVSANACRSLYDAKTKECGTTTNDVALFNGGKKKIYSKMFFGLFQHPNRANIRCI